MGNKCLRRKKPQTQQEQKPLVLKAQILVLLQIKNNDRIYEEYVSVEKNDKWKALSDYLVHTYFIEHSISLLDDKTNSPLIMSDQINESIIVRAVVEVDIPPAQITEQLSEQQQVKKKPIIIGITGPTQAGKSFIAKCLYLSKGAQILCIDQFYDVQKVENQLHGNWETPEGIIWEYFIVKIQDEIQKCQQPILVIEGFTLFSNPKVMELCDRRIYIDITEQEIYKRRMKNKRVPEWIFREQIIPEYRKYRSLLMDRKDIFFIDGMQADKLIFQQVKSIINGELTAEACLIENTTNSKLLRGNKPLPKKNNIDIDDDKKEEKEKGRVIEDNKSSEEHKE